MKAQCTLLILAAVWLTSNVGVVKALYYDIPGADCFVSDVDTIEKCIMEPNEDDNGVTCLSSVLELTKPWGASCETYVTVLKISEFGGPDMGTGVEMNGTAEDLLTKKNAMGDEVIKALNFRPDDFPVSPGQYGNPCYKPSEDFLPAVFPRGKYKFVLKVQCNNKPSMQVEVQANVPYAD